MTTRTRIQLELQQDTGSIFYQDKDDHNLAFHIEAYRGKTLIPSSDAAASFNNTSNPTSKDGDHSVPGRSAPDDDDDDDDEGPAATTDLIKSFLRQHLLNNGEASRSLIPLMKKDGIQALLVAMVGLHLRKDGQGEGENGVRDVGTAIMSLHKTLGSLISVLQQRERVLKYLEENPQVVLGDDIGEEQY
ncbi:hypothetical protein Daus18300_001393 [Diaporthe australafricana]|uniref:Uncharacterized protein n=1 Tax=Diaporthe australafricana TaxID=127596 RepID=A0ABR3XVJ7_9PEZI